jgi:hypothetical protein
MRLSPRAAFSTMVLVPLLAACGSTSSTDTADQAAQPVVETTSAPATTVGAVETTIAEAVPGAVADTTPPATEPAVAVPEALNFSAPLVGGGEFVGADVAGLPVAFWFWAPT